MTIGTIIIIVLATIINGLLLKHHIKYFGMSRTLHYQNQQAIYGRNKLSKRKDEKYDMMMDKYHEYIEELKSRDIVDQEKKPWEEPEWKWERGN